MSRNIPRQEKIRVLSPEELEALQAVNRCLIELDPMHNSKFPESLTPPWTEHDDRLPEHSFVTLVSDPERAREIFEQAIKVRSELGMHGGRSFDFFQLAESLDTYVTTIGQTDAPPSAKHLLLTQEPFLTPCFMIPIDEYCESSPYEHAIVLNDTHSDQCQRFNTAKRLSHLLLGHNYPTINAAQSYNFASLANAEANAFAIFLLMPVVKDGEVPSRGLFEPSHARARLELEELIARKT